MAPTAAPTTVTAAWAGPFDAETPFGIVEPGAELEIPFEQACGGHWVDPQTGEPFQPIPAAESEPLELGAGEPVDANSEAGEAQGQTLTADDTGEHAAGDANPGEEPI